MTTGSPVHFRVYPQAARTLFFRVKIWDTRQQMRAHLLSRHCWRPRADAMCLLNRWRRNRVAGPDRTKRECGEIHFYRDKLIVNLASHEFVHAALWWAIRLRLDPMAQVPVVDNDSDEERFCYAQQRMLHEFCVGVKRCGLSELLRL